MAKIPMAKRINQCMSCKFHSGATFCNHWNANDPKDSNFCYDWKDLEEDEAFDASIDARDELIDRRTE